MAYASKAGRARVSPSNPQAQAVCQRCGIWYNRVDLNNQMEWRGSALLPIFIFVCRECYDVPQEQLRAIVIPADPVPIKFPLTEPFVADETNYLTTNATTTDLRTGIPVPSDTKITATDGTYMTPVPIGKPVGPDDQPAIPPLSNATGAVVHYGVPLKVLSVIANGSDQVTVTCSSPHNLVTNGQVAVEGISNRAAAGFFSVTVASATAFTYQTYSLIPAGGLITSTTLINNCVVGLPLDYPQIPQLGPWDSGGTSAEPADDGGELDFSETDNSDLFPGVQ